MMPRRGNPVAVGAFVIGAIVLVIVGALVLGAARWLQGDLRFVLRFHEAVTGLVAGSPVEFRGVKVGEVGEILALYDPKVNDFYFPVLITIQTDRFERLGSRGKGMDSQEVAAALIEKGLRARLETQSFVTGQKRIAIDFFPGKGPEYTGPPLRRNLIELPTVPSQTEDIANLLRQIPFERLGRDLVQIVEGLKGLVGPGSDGKVLSLNDLLVDLQGKVGGMERELLPMLREGRSTLGALRGALDEGRAAIAAADASLKSVGGAAASVEQTSAEARAAVVEAQAAFKQVSAGLEQARAALANVEHLTGADSAVLYDVTRAARELAAAGQAVRALAEELRARPDALLRGKPPGQGAR